MKELLCRAGALRGQRSLHDAYIVFGAGFPLVGAKILQATNGSREYTRHEVTARTGVPTTGLRLWGGRAQWARPAGHND